MIAGLRAVKTGVGPKMENHIEIPLAEQFAATIAWWRDAGVDYEYSDEIVALLADEEEAPARAVRASPGAMESETPAEPALKAADLPQDLPTFREWWVSADNPFGSRHAPCLAPIGKAGAPVMILTTMPEAEDRDSLLSGPQGRLLGNILRAIGLDPNLAYLASALPCHTTLPDWNQLGTDGLGMVIAHHIGLARPQRILLLGSKLPTLLGHDPAASPDTFSEIAGTATLATFAPDRLLDHAHQRARFWKRLCQWTAPA